ncbi:MAG TPA: ABC transporter ATP-binding protein, partial [Firmicutes bacterium]|nr:ABC transporter ATP-binding protein [Bacillota bacterium]
MSERNARPPRRGPMGGPMGGGPMMPGAKAKDFKGSMKKLLHYMAQYKFRVLLVMLFAVASTVFMIVGPKILGNATTEMTNGIMGKVTGTGEGIDFSAIARILISLVLLYVASAAFSYIQGWLMTGVTMKVTYHLRNDIARKINRLPLKYFDRTSHGEVLSRVTNDIDTLAQSLNQSITQIITSVATFVGI